MPLVIRTQQGGGRGNAAQHSQSLETVFTHIPGLKVAIPATPYDAKGLLKSAFRDQNPVVFIEHKLLYATRGPVPEEEYIIPFGQAEVKRAGEDVTLVSLSRTVLHSLEAAEAAANAAGDVDVLSGLEGLIDKNLIEQWEVGGEPRFTMLETIREYALERLHESGETGVMQRQHAHFFLERAEEAEPGLRRANMAAVADRLQVEHWRWV